MDVRPGDTVVVSGAAGSVGSAAVQFLRELGAKPIGTARPDNHDYLRALGAVPVEYGPGLLDRLADVAPNGVDAAVDCGTHGFVRQVLHVLPARRIVTVVDFEASAWAYS